MIDATLLIDPAAPEGHAAGPALTTLRWRYGNQIRWTITMASPAARGPVAPAEATRRLVELGERSGMPVDATPRERSVSSGRAARAFVAARTQRPDLGWATLRALQFAWSASNALLDRDEAIAAALWAVEGLDVVEVLVALDDDEAVAAAVAIERTLPPTPSPTIVFRDAAGRRLVAAGPQPIEAYEVCLANLDPDLVRRDPPANPMQALLAFGHGLATAELATVLERDRSATRAALIDLVADGVLRRTPMGDDALWRADPSPLEPLGVQQPAQEALRLGTLRRVEDLLGCAPLDDQPLVQEADLVGHLGGE
jgi:predicted DsbA family dithiol-disulfide isomerase